MTDAFSPLLKAALNTSRPAQQSSGQVFMQGFDRGVADRQRDEKAVREQNMLTLRDLTESGVSDEGITAAFGNNTGALQRAKIDLASVQSGEALSQLKVQKEQLAQRAAIRKSQREAAVDQARFVRESARQLRDNPELAPQLISELADAGVFNPQSLEQAAAINNNPQAFLDELDRDAARTLARHGELEAPKLTLGQERAQIAADLFQARDEQDLERLTDEQIEAVSVEHRRRLQEERAAKLQRSRAVGSDAVSLQRGVAGKQQTAAISADATLNLISRIRQMGPSDEFQSALGKLKIAGGRTLAGLSPSILRSIPGAEDFLRRAQIREQGIRTVFNAVRRDVTGAAGAEKELREIEKSTISMAQDPITFDAAMEELERTQRRVKWVSEQLQARKVPLGSPNYGAEFDRLWGQSMVNEMNRTFDALGGTPIPEETKAVESMTLEEIEAELGQ